MAVKIPHYIDVVASIERSALEMSRDASLGLCAGTSRYLLPKEKRLEFSFSRLGDKQWKLRVAVEKVGGETASSAFRILVWLPGGETKDETVYLTSEEQVADLGLRYAEVITSAAADPVPAA